MEDQGCGLDRLGRMGVMGLTKEAVKIMRQNVPLFLSFVTSFTIPCGLFTIFLLSAIDIHHRYVLEDFISKGELVIFGWKFETMISPLGLNFGFIFLNLAPVAWLNTAVCTRGVVSIYRNEDLTTSIKHSFLHVQWAVLRLVATQSLLYCYLFIVLGIFLIPDRSSIPSSAPVHIGRYLSWVLTSTVVVLLYHLPTPQVAILECKNYGFRGVFRAAEIAYSNLSTAIGLAFFSVSYFCLLKLLVDVLLRDSYPFWTKFLVYPPLVVSVIAMSIFWQVVYTLFYLSNSLVDLDKVDAIQADMESSGEAADINEPLLADDVERNESNSNSQHATV